MGDGRLRVGKEKRTCNQIDRGKTRLETGVVTGTVV